MHNFLIHRINRQIAKSLPYSGRVVDLGCGTAPYKDHILSVADEYIGVDWESSYHDTSQVDIFADLAQKLPIEDNFADTLTAFQVMEHLPEPVFFLSECYRILRPNGQLFITVPFMWQVHEAPQDYYRYTRYGLQYLLNKTGFTDIEIKENTGFWQTIVLHFNYHSKRYARGILKYPWMVVWWFGQVLSPILDRIDKNPGETASYTVQARKPA